MKGRFAFIFSKNKGHPDEKDLENSKFCYDSLEG